MVWLAIIVSHDLHHAPQLDWPEWNHTGRHHYLGHLFWNDFHFHHQGQLVFSDAPDFYSELAKPDGSYNRFWGDIGKVSAQAFALTIKCMRSHDLWISIVDQRTQIIIEPFVDLTQRLDDIFSAEGLGCE